MRKRQKGVALTGVEAGGILARNCQAPLLNFQTKMSRLITLAAPYVNHGSRYFLGLEIHSRYSERLEPGRPASVVWLHSGSGHQFSRHSWSPFKNMVVLTLSVKASFSAIVAISCFLGFLLSFMAFTAAMQRKPQSPLPPRSQVGTPLGPLPWLWLSWFKGFSAFRILGGCFPSGESKAVRLAVHISWSSFSPVS